MTSSHPLARPRRPLPGRPDDRPRHDDRERRAAVDPQRPRLLADVARLGRQRLPADLRRLPAARRPARRPVRPRAGSSSRGITLFTVASLVCGLSTTQGMLIAARAVQGVGGAIVSAVAFSLIVDLFTEPRRAREGDGRLRLRDVGRRQRSASSLGGVLTDVARLALDLPRQPADRRRSSSCSRCGCCRPCTGRRLRARVDVAGAVTVTAALMLAVYAIVNGNAAAGRRRRRSACSRRARRLLAAFLVIESRVASPLMPLRLFRHAQPRDGEHRRDPLVGGDVRVVLPLGALPPARARTTARCRSASRSCRRT